MKLERAGKTVFFFFFCLCVILQQLWHFEDNDNNDDNGWLIHFVSRIRFLLSHTFYKHKRGQTNRHTHTYTNYSTQTPLLENLGNKFCKLIFYVSKKRQKNNVISIINNNLREYTEKKICCIFKHIIICNSNVNFDQYCKY